MWIIVTLVVIVLLLVALGMAFGSFLSSAGLRSAGPHAGMRRRRQHDAQLPPGDLVVTAQPSNVEDDYALFGAGIHGNSAHLGPDQSAEWRGTARNGASTDDVCVTNCRSGPPGYPIPVV